MSEEQVQRVRLYTRSGCRLCDEIAPVLAELAADGRISVETIDIETDPELLRRYGDRIPVVEIENGPTFAGRISAFRIRRALTGTGDAAAG